MVLSKVNWRTVTSAAVKLGQVSATESLASVLHGRPYRVFNSDINLRLYSRTSDCGVTLGLKPGRLQITMVCDSVLGKADLNIAKEEIEHGISHCALSYIPR